MSEDVSHHVRTVLRLRPGAEIELFNGAGCSAKGKITSISPSVVVEIIDIYEADESGTISLLVGQGLLKGKKMDLVVQKCTELGVSTFTPVVSSRCQSGSKQRGGQRDKRWRRIVESASGQCRRNRFMDLNDMTTLEDFLQASRNMQSTCKLLFWEEEKECHFRDLPVLTGFNRVIILLGPEGGFSKDEVLMAQDSGYSSVSLGRRILRAETATIAAVAILQNMLGNLE